MPRCDCGAASPVRRRGRRAAAVLAAVALGALAAPGPAAAQWRQAATVSAPLSAATLGSRLELVSGGGTVSADGSRFSMGGLLVGSTGYVDLVNSSTVPATLSLTVSMGTLVGSSPASVCPVAWVPATGTCPGASTTVAMTVLLGVSSGTYTTPVPVPPGGRVHVRVAIGSVAGGVDLTAGTAVPRAAGERTTA